MPEGDSLQSPESMTKRAAAARPDPLQQRLRLMRLVTAVVAVTLLTLGWLTWSTYSSYRYLNNGDKTIDRIEHLRGEIRLKDEALTMTAKMAAATGDRRWEARYRKLGPQLTSAITELESLAPQIAMSHAALATEDANRKLVAMERESFRLGSAGRSDEAQALLASEKYLEQKSRYADSMATVDKQLAAIITAETNRQQAALKLSLVAIGFLVPVLVITWFLMVRSAQKWQVMVEEQNKSLSMANQELQLAKEMADEANRAKSWFLSRMSHELRTPLNAIIGFGQFLADSDLNEEQRNDANQILKGSHHLLQVVSEVLDISRLEMGSRSVSLERVDVTEVCQEAINLMRPIAQEKGVTLEFFTEHGFYTIADRRRLQQVLLNLFSNSIKYNKNGGKAELRVTESFGRRLSFEVHDTGIGMSAETMKKLFTPFERFGANRKGVEGSGLGLVLSRTLVESMGGQMDVSSKEGIGTWVRFSLVKFEPNVHDIPSALVAEAVQPAEEGPKTKILLIEDNPLSAELMTLVFQERPNIEVSLAGLGSEGIELARNLVPSVIFLDLHLPDTSGKFVLAELKSHPDTRAIPVVFVTADDSTATAREVTDQGAFAYVSKPISLPRILEVLDAALEERRRAA